MGGAARGPHAGDPEDRDDRAEGDHRDGALAVGDAGDGREEGDRADLRRDGNTARPPSSEAEERQRAQEREHEAADDAKDARLLPERLDGGEVLDEGFGGQHRAARGAARSTGRRGRGRPGLRRRREGRLAQCGRPDGSAGATARRWAGSEAGGGGSAVGTSGASTSVVAPGGSATSSPGSGEGGSAEVSSSRGRRLLRAVAVRGKIPGDLGGATPLARCVGQWGEGGHRQRQVAPGRKVTRRRGGEVTAARRPTSVRAKHRTLSKLCGSVLSVSGSM